MKKLLTLLLLLPTLVFAQAVVVPSPVPSCANNDVLKWSSATSLFVCASASATSQPLSDASGLIANSSDPTKILAFALSGITTATTRTWTIPNANLTIPTTIASLAANTFTALQTLSGGITTTTGIFSSTVSIAGATTLNTVAYTWPGSQGAADTFLKNNGAGVLSWGSQSAALPSPVTQNLIFTDNTYDIGASGATRPRNYFGAGNATLGGTLGVTGATTITSLSATSGAFSTTLSVTGASTLAAISATSGSFSSLITATGAITSSAGLAGTTGTFSSTLGVTGATTLTGALIGDATTDSTSITTGAFQTDGGLGVAKALWVGGLANIAGAVTLQSTLAVTTSMSVPFGSFGTSPATSGTLRLPNAATISSRNAANSGNIGILNLSSLNVAIVGADTVGDSVANNGTLSLGVLQTGLLVIASNVDRTCVFVLSNAVVFELSDPDSLCSVTQGTASSINLYNNGGAVELENKSGSSRSFVVSNLK